MIKNLNEEHLTQCWSCQYWEPYKPRKHADLSDYGECKFHAPRASEPIMTSEDLRHEDRDCSTWWPKTDGGEWCSRYLADVGLIWETAQIREREQHEK